jgi:hypothetical protein
LIARRPGAIDRVLPAALSRSRNSVESKICQHISKKQAVKKLKNDGGAKI